MLGHGDESIVLEYVNSSLFVAAARPTLAVDRQLDHSFKTLKVPCDWLKVGRDKATPTPRPLPAPGKGRGVGVATSKYSKLQPVRPIPV